MKRVKKDAKGRKAQFARASGLFIEVIEEVWCGFNQKTRASNYNQS
jgi:hypothetical protein